MPLNKETNHAIQTDRHWDIGYIHTSHSYKTGSSVFKIQVLIRIAMTSA